MDPCAIEYLKDEHNRLLKKVMADRPTSDEERRRAIIKDAKNLIEDIEQCMRVANQEDSEWLRPALAQFAVINSILEIPQVIDCYFPTEALYLEKKSFYDSFVDDREMEEWIRRIAYNYSIMRRAQYLLDGVDDILQRAEEITTGKDDRDFDWNRAKIYAASMVVDGKLDLARQLGSDTYYRLESVWLKDVKELKAYFLWRRTKRAAEDNYFSACNEIRRRLLVCDKGSLHDFKEIQNYIQDLYLSNGKVRPDDNPNVEELIRRKSQRIWETTGGIHSDAMNWGAAERYTKMFYENIIPAIESKNIDHTLSVLNAFGLSKAAENRYAIISAFEAAIAIYFLDPKSISDILHRELVTWDMIL